MPVLKIAREVHSAIYNTNLTNQTTAIQKYYAPNSTFNDPLVSVEGKDEIALNFKPLASFKYIKNNVSSILLSTIASNNLAETRDLVVIDSILVFGLVVVDVPIRCITRLEFNIEGLIVVHEDIWSVSDIIASMPILGSIYGLSRRFTGYFVSGLGRKLGNLLDGNGNGSGKKEIK